MQMMDFGGLPQFGGGSMYPGGPMTMAGPSGFAGPMAGLGGGMFGAQDDPQKKKGFNPLMLMSPFAAMAFGSKHPGNTMLSMLSPAFGIGHALGLFGHHGG